MSASQPFDLTPGACSACSQHKDDPLVSCIDCEAVVHVQCYHNAKKDIRWMCDLCSVQLVESTCVLCGHTSEEGILQRVRDAEYARINPSAAAAAAAAAAQQGAAAPHHFAHTFCLSLYRSSPSKPAPCRVCGKDGARLSCEVCLISFHPFCALQSPATLQITPSGNILCYCDAHLKSSATAALTAPVLPLMPMPLPLPLPQLTRPPPPAATIAAAPKAAVAAAAAAHKPAPSAATATRPSAAATTATAPSPVVKREVDSSRPTAAASDAASTKAATKSPAASASPRAGPAAPPASKRPVANISTPFTAPTLAAAAPASAAAAASAAPSASPSASPTGLSKKEAFAARLKASSPPAPAVATKSNGKDSALTAAKHPDKPADKAADKAVAKSSASSFSSKSTASSKAAAASASASVAASSKPAKPASSSSKGARATAAAAPAPPAAAAASRFTSHPSLRRGGLSSSSSDSDEGEAEWSGTDVPSAQHDKRRMRQALEEIREINEESKEVDDENCRVCGESWAEDAFDADGNPANDEMVICEGCEGSYHQSCYGLDEVPAGDFFCWPCKAGRKKGEVQCVICKGKEWRGFCEVKYDSTRTDRAVFKAQRKHKHFAHTSCVLWSADTWFGDIVHRNPACGVENIPADAYKLKCIKCTRPGGAKLQCQYKECVQSFHPLCMLNHPDEFFRDAHEEDEQAMPKEYYCAHHSRTIRRERERARLAAAGESTEDIDAEIEAETPQVVPTTSLLPPSKLVAVVPLKQGRRKIVRLEVDPEDQEMRAKEFEEASIKVKLKREEEEDEAISHTSGDESVQSGRNGGNRAKRKKTHIDADVESVDSDSSADSRGSNNKRRRLRKGTADTKPKLQLSSGQSSAAAASSSSTDLAGDLEISSSSNAQIETRRAVRNQLMQLVGLSLSNDIEAGVYDACGRSTNARYKQRAADLQYNLTHNPSLLASLVDGGLSVKRLLAMDYKALATDQQKRARASEQAETLRDKTAAPHAVLLTNRGERVAIDPSTGKRIERATRSSK